jgi:hypothetical protein
VIPRQAENSVEVPARPAPEAAIPSGPPSAAEVAQAAADFRIQCGSITLLTVLSLLIYVLLTIHVPALALWFATGVWGGTGLLSVALPLANRVLSLKPGFLDQVKGRLGDLMKRPRVALFLAGTVAVGLPGTASDWYLHHEFSVIRIVPGRELSDLLGETGVNNQLLYEIVVLLGRTTENGAIQWAEEAQCFPLDASSLTIGASKHYLGWRATQDLDLADKQARALIDDDKAIARWKRNPVLLATRRLRAGDKIQINFRCRRNALLLFQSPDETVTSDQPNLKTIELEPANAEEFFQHARQCEPASP